MAERAVSWNSSQLIPTAVGLLLLSAAGLKVLYPSPAPQIFLFSSPALSIALVETELLIGLWLWSGLWPAACRLSALGLFFAFVLFNWAQVRAGAASCCCFGKIPLSPWAGLYLDLLAVAGLCFWRPATKDIRSGLRLALFSAAFLLAALPAAWAVGHSSRTDFPLVVSPNPLDLGTLGRGQTSRGRVALLNRGSEPVMIGHAETSCPCLRVILPTKMVLPSQEVLADIIVDLALEPEYTGRLVFQVDGFTPAGKKVFGFGSVVRVN